MSFWTQADIDKLRAAIAGGVLSVRYDGPPARQVTYHSLAEMRDLLAEMRAEVNGAGASRTRRVSYSKGFR